jgi:hypothetical protein
MSYFVSENPSGKSARLLPFACFVFLACLSSLGALAPVLFSDLPSIQRLVDYQLHRTVNKAPESNAPLNNEAESMNAGGMSLRAATLYVHSITDHSQGRDLVLWENWLQWLIGQFYSPLLRTQNTRWIISGGQGDCSERAAVLQDLLKCHGVESRFIGLGGHVVLEARTEQGFWVLDPDYGICFETGIERLEGRAPGELAAWLVEQGLAPKKSFEYERLIKTQQDNVKLDWNHPLSPRLKRIEDLCEWAVWVVPAMCWLCVFWSMQPKGGLMA